MVEVDLVEEMIQPAGVEAARPTDNSVHRVPGEKRVGLRRHATGPDGHRPGKKVKDALSLCPTHSYFFRYPNDVILTSLITSFERP